MADFRYKNTSRDHRPISSGGPDRTSVVDWTLKINYLCPSLAGQSDTLQVPVTQDRTRSVPLHRNHVFKEEEEEEEEEEATNILSSVLKSDCFMTLQRQ